MIPIKNYKPGSTMEFQPRNEQDVKKRKKTIPSNKKPINRSNVGFSIVKHPNVPGNHSEPSEQVKPKPDIPLQKSGPISLFTKKESEKKKEIVSPNKLDNSLSNTDMYKYVDSFLETRIHNYMGKVEKQKADDLLNLKKHVQCDIKEKLISYQPKELEKQIEIILANKNLHQNNHLTQNDLKTVKEELLKEMVNKTDLEKLQQTLDAKTKDMVTKQTLDAKTKDMVTKKELALTREDILRIMNEKMNVVDIRELTEKYVKEMIEKDEDKEHTNDEDSKTKFETIIEPAVARIIHRVMKYDNIETREKCITDGDSMASSLDFHDVYGEKSPDKTENPYFGKELTATKEDNIVVDMGTVYKEENISLQSNELRTSKYHKWSKLGDGVKNGNVIDMFMDKRRKKIYIAGHFEEVNGLPVENIAVYDLENKSWKHVGEGIPNVASSLAVDEENEILYVSGIFNKVGKGNSQINATNIAGYDLKNNTWFSLGDGLDKDCHTIVFDPTSMRLYAGGNFKQSGDKKMAHIGYYELKTNAWFPIKGGSLNSAVRTIILSPTKPEIYVGGLFTATDNKIIKLSYLGKYNLREEKWYGISGGTNSSCNTMSLSNDHLYIGGNFTKVGEKNETCSVNYVAKYCLKTKKWNDMNGGVNNVVQSLYYDTNAEVLYVGGSFTNISNDSLILNHIAKYIPKESKWCSLESYFDNMNIDIESKKETTGVDGICKVLSIDDKSLFIAGNFKNAGNISANSIARYAL